MDIVLRGNQDTIAGNFPAVGEKAPDFTAFNLEDQKVTLQDYKGEVVLLNVFPDIDTGVCSMQTGRFNEMAQTLEGVKIVSISTNSKEEQQNWCAGKQIEMEMLRDTDRSFGKAYGILVKNADKLGRSVFVINREGEVVYREVVQNMSNEPDYEAAAQEARQAAAELL